MTGLGADATARLPSRPEAAAASAVGLHGAREPGRGRVPVLLIACAGRSGSTLLERIVGTCDGFCPVGELRFVWERAFGENQLCGCGVPFDDCLFWNRVSRHAFGVNAAQMDATLAAELRGSLDEIRHAPWLIQSHSPAFHKSALAAYGELLQSLCSAILRVSGEQVIVDSSGDATHGLILSRLPGIELHVIHLVRDARAVAFSWKRARRRPEIHWASEDMPIERASTSAIRWMVHNALAEKLRRPAASYCRLRYEDFVADPAAGLAQALAPYEWARDACERIAGSELLLEPTHTVSGNPMRFTQGPIRIRLDDEWRKAMQSRDRRIVTALGWWQLARYGYKVKSDE